MRSLLGTWATLRPDLSTPIEIRSHRAEFVRFVFARRLPTMPMGEWLSESKEARHSRPRYSKTP